MVIHLSAEQDETINVKLNDKQIDKLLRQPERTAIQRGYTGFNIGIIGFNLSPMDLIRKKVKIDISLIGIPVGSIVLDSNSIEQSIGPNIGIAKASITLRVDWNNNNITYVAKACVRKFYRFSFKWKCADYDGTLTTW